ncbi:farnesol dehydrogenase-like [Ischnura elegans]|uniref:farnesol dehydrogenase-like n=1 Tax=Ischnura elegans TaxID=197161 RepID=UPI001ED8A382|nr:farnesol dehydrogenase-like [Ischnura elegans]
MERWAGKVAVVTGASAGIGAAIVEALVHHGMIVVGLARRVDILKDMAENLSEEKGRLYPLKADVSDEAQVIHAFQWVKENLKTLHVLVNNAGVLGDIPISEKLDTKVFLRIFDVNVIGLSVCTSEGLKLMQESGVDDGHIFHINSISGQYIHPTLGAGQYPYMASKHSVTVLAEGLRRELVEKKSNIRVTSISPGLVKTEIFDVSHDRRATTIFDNNPALNPQDIADALIYALGTPPHVQIKELTIKPVGEML